MTQNTKHFNIFAAIAFCLLALCTFGWSVRLSSVESVLTLISFVLIIVPLLRNKRSVVTALGFALMSAASFAAFLLYIIHGMSFAHVLQKLVPLLGAACAMLFSLALTTDLLPQVRDFAKKAFFLPSLFSLINWLMLLLGTILSLITGFGFWAYGLRSLFSAFLSSILLAAALFFAMAYLAGGEAEDEARSSAPDESGDYYHCGLVKHILLLLFTFGIWQYIWIYRTTRFCNRLEDESERNPGVQLLLCMFVPFFSIYWTYQSARRIDRISRESGLGSDLAMLCLILAIFVGIIPPILMQDQINTIVGIERGTVRVKGSAAREQKAAANDDDLAAKLQTYKNLLDNGLITQEEYEAKKKQILGL